MTDSDTDTETDETNETDTEPDGQMLDADAVAQLAQTERRATKTMVFETDAGVAEYEYQMIREGRLAELSDKHFDTPDVRGRQQATEQNIDSDSYEQFRAEVLKESITAAPQGHKNSRQYIRQNVPDGWQAELFEAITEFSTMDEETYLKFR